MRAPKYRNVLRPSVEFLATNGKLMLDTKDMADFLGVPRRAFKFLVYTDRVPLPVRLGFGKCFRWSVLEVLEWVEAGCPRRRAWIAMRGRSGWYPL
jgi:predicted DNA-binding transcriptional regulator AlpA